MSAAKAQPVGSPARTDGVTADDAPPKLPHERDQSLGSAGTTPRKIIEQARKDIESGLVDTDMRATPGLDAPQRRKMVKQPAKR